MSQNQLIEATCYAEATAKAAGGSKSAQAKMVETILDRVEEAYRWCDRRNVSAANAATALRMMEGGTAVCH